MKSLTDLIWTEEKSNATIVVNPSIIKKSLKEICIAIFCTFTSGAVGDSVEEIPASSGKLSCQFK